MARDSDLRSTILSIGLPIVVPGEQVYRGETILMPPGDGDPEAAIGRGWVDLRAPNCAVWIARARRIMAQAEARSQAAGTGSDEDWEAIAPEEPISPARLAAWVFQYEDAGQRIKR
ncbi:MAG: hypothetical protein HYY94_00510 [Gemmatimonadetes bacterium]|nr:hypothetical protein [Gemmatimonadota bacterium]